MNDYFIKVKDWWKNQNKNRRLIYVVTTAVLFLTIIIFSIVKRINSEKMVILYSSLSEADASAITQELEKEKVPYNLEAGGSIIKVSESQVYQLRLKLASAGIPKGGVVGFEIFDKMQLGQTEFQQRLNYQRALEGELARTITSLEYVEATRIHIVLREHSLFIEEELPAKASITLKISPSKSLTTQQIHGISYLVASSVEGLSDNNITIIDENGKILLSPQDDDTHAALSNTQLQIKESVEKSLSRKPQEMLDKVLGHGMSVVRINVELDFDQIQKTIEEFDDKSPVVRSEELITVNDSSGDQEHTITNFEISKTVQQILSGALDIKQISISALIDGKYVETLTEEGNLVYEYFPRTDSEMLIFSNIIKEAVGFNEERGDHITVENIPFETHEDPIEFFEYQESPINKIIIFGVSLLLLIIIIGIIMARRRNLKLQRLAEEEKLRLAEEERFKLAEAEKTRELTTGEKVLKLLTEQPDVAARIVRNWITTSKSSQE